MIACELGAGQWGCCPRNSGAEFAVEKAGRKTRPWHRSARHPEGLPLWTPPKGVRITACVYALRTQRLDVEIDEGLTVAEILTRLGIATWATVRVWDRRSGTAAGVVRQGEAARPGFGGGVLTRAGG